MAKFVFNMNSKKSELGWQKAFDDFWVKFTPLLFDYLQWILVLGTLHYLAYELKIWQAGLLLALGFAALIFYFQSYFYNLEIQGINFLKNNKTRKLLALSIGGVLAFGTYEFIRLTIVQISGKF